jgi:hypothetical protein
MPVHLFARQTQLASDYGRWPYLSAFQGDDHSADSGSELVQQVADLFAVPEGVLSGQKLALWIMQLPLDR